MVSAAELVAPNLYPQPLWFPQAFDSTRQFVRMFRFDADDYRAAAFLDSRGISDGMRYAIVPFDLLAANTPANARRDAHWIFHISHVGSTLISRLLGELDGVLAYREPRVLRVLAVTPPDQAAARLPVLRALLSRVFDGQQRAIVKATSWVSEQAVALAGPTSDHGKVALIGVTPERFIAGRLGTNRKELRDRTGERLTRLARRLPGLDHAEARRSEARIAAMSWAAESTAIEAAAQAIRAKRCHWIDFDSFLAEPDRGLFALARHFSLGATPATVKAVIEGPLMGRYSKADDQPFDPAQRERNLAAQLAENSADISDAMHWLEARARESSLLGAALDRWR